MRWAAAMIIGLAGCSSGETARDAAPTVREIALRDFTGIALDSGDQVEVTQGDGFSVRVEGDAATQERINIRREGDLLNIGRKPGGLWSISDSLARVRITMPTIRVAVLSGSGDLSIDRTGDDFAATLGGSGDMTIGQLRGDKAALTVAGTGKIAAAGAVRHLNLSVAGSGDIDARQVKASEATVSVAGTGDVAADIAGPVQVSLVGSGSATLGPDARCVVNRTGTGRVDCG